MSRNTTSTDVSQLDLPALQARLKELTGETSRTPNPKFYIRRIEEALARGGSAEQEAGPTAKRRARGRPKERIRVGARRATEATFKVLPLRLEEELADSMDAAWRGRGIKNRMDFLRVAIGRYLKHIGAGDVGELFLDRPTRGER